MRPVRLRALVPATALLAVLAACGSSDEPSGDGGSRSGESSASPSAEASPTESPSAAGTGNAANEVEVADLGFAFEAPAGWTEVDPDVIKKGGGSKVVADIAERMGMTEEQMLTAFSQQAELMLFSDKQVKGFVPNVNVVTVPGVTEVTEEMIRRDFGTLGAKIEQIGEVETGLGTARAVTYSMAPGGVTMYGHGMFFQQDGKAVNITVTTPAKAAAEQIGTTIAESLRPL